MYISCNESLKERCFDDLKSMYSDKVAIAILGVVLVQQAGILQCRHPENLEQEVICFYPI
jgi:hypothetical protein